MQMAAELIRKDSLQNVRAADGKTQLFRMAVYPESDRGCFLSLLTGFYIEADGIEIPSAAQYLSLHGQPMRRIEQLRTQCWEHWDPREEAWLYLEGHLDPGMHAIKFAEGIMSGLFKTEDSWLENPPQPGFGWHGSSRRVSEYELELQKDEAVL